MDLDDLPRLGAERPRPVQDLAGHAELADVVQSGGEVEFEEVERAHPKSLADATSKPHHGVGVLGRVAVPDCERSLERTDLDLCRGAANGSPSSGALQLGLSRSARRLHRP